MYAQQSAELCARGAMRGDMFDMRRDMMSARYVTAMRVQEDE